MADVMAWPLNLEEYAYNAEDIQRWMAGKTSGVYGAEDNWQVISTGGMGLTIKAAGQTGGWLSNFGRYGIVFWNDTDISLTVSTADGTLSRIDRVVVSWHIPQQVSVPTIEVRKGTPSSEPVGPALVNDGEYAEICLAEIHLSAGQTEISSQHIVDTRLDESLCGIVSMGIEKYPTDGLEAEFRDWLDNLKTNLDENTAANLLNNIETHKSDTTVHMRQLSYSKSGTVHQLTGLSGVSGTVSAVFTATAAYAAGDTFTVDGTAYTVQLSNGEDASDNLFVAGAAVPIVLDTAGKKVNFKTGGGLSNSKLALATAQESDVATGKTFYAGNNQLKTGSLIPYKMATGSFNGLDNDESSVTITCGFQANYVMLWHDSEIDDVKSCCAYSNGQGKGLVFSSPGSPDINMPANYFIAPSSDGFIAKKTADFCSFGNDKTIYYTAFGV